MSMKIVWVPVAQRDLLGIDRYFTEVAWKVVANRQLKKVVKASGLLQDQPYLGHISPNDPDVLEWHIPNTTYTLPYLIDNDQIIILRVFDERQNKPNHWLV